MHKRFLLPQLFILIFSMGLMAQSTDLYYGTPTPKKEKKSKEKRNSVEPGSPKETGKTLFEFQFGLGLTFTNAGVMTGTVSNIPGMTMSTIDTKTKQGFNGHWGANFPIKNDFYVVAKNNFQVEKTESKGQPNSATILNLALGVEKRYKGFFGGLDFVGGTALVTINDGYYDYVSTVFGVNLNAGYRLSNGIKFGFTQKISGKTTYELVFINDPYYTNLQLSGTDSKYKSSTSSFYVAYDLSVRKKGKKEPRKKDNYLQGAPENTGPRLVGMNTQMMTDEQLQTQLKIALEKENYPLAEQIQKEIDSRKVTNEYASKTLPELTKMLDEALKAEDYKKAELIQTEIDKRSTIKKTENNGANGNANKTTKAPGKKSLKELQEEMKKAIDSEDYKKAEQIQKEINNFK